MLACLLKITSPDGKSHKKTWEAGRKDQCAFEMIFWSIMYLSLITHASGSTTRMSIKMKYHRFEKQSLCQFTHDVLRYGVIIDFHKQPKNDDGEGRCYCETLINFYFATHLGLQYNQFKLAQRATSLSSMTLNAYYGFFCTVLNAVWFGCLVHVIISMVWIPEHRWVSRCTMRSCRLRGFVQISIIYCKNIHIEKYIFFTAAIWLRSFRATTLHRWFKITVAICMFWLGVIAAYTWARLCSSIAHGSEISSSNGSSCTKLWSSMPTALILCHLLIVPEELGVINCTQSLGENVSVLQQEDSSIVLLQADCIQKLGTVFVGLATRLLSFYCLTYT